MEVALPELPEPDVEPDEDGWLFDSNRDYLEQLACYQAHQNDTGDDPPESRRAALISY
jgi:hypothetical protein